MHLLLDANLSWRLKKILSSHFDKIDHVDQCELEVPAIDSQIWDWAKKNNAVIVTNDEDYYYLSLQKGFPPKVVLLRIGNQSTQNVSEVLIVHKDNIEAFNSNAEYGLLEIL